MNHFFYGTLMRGLQWNRLVEGEKFLSKAVYLGAKLYLLPDTHSPIPVMVDTRDSGDVVVGELWDIQNPLLQHQLAQFEREAGYFPVGRTVRCIPDEGEVIPRCFIYPEGAITSEFLPVVGGDFRKFLTQGGRNE